MEFTVVDEPIFITKSSILGLKSITAKLKIDGTITSLNQNYLNSISKLFLNKLLETDIIDDDNKLYAKFLVETEDQKFVPDYKKVNLCIKTVKKNLESIFPDSFKGDNATFKINKIISHSNYMVVFMITAIKTQSKPINFILKASMKNDNEMKEHWDSEINIAKHLKGCDYVMDYVDSKSIDDNHYIIYKFFSETTLNMKMIKMSDEEKRDYFKLILPNLIDGMKEFINRGVIHRDIKPDNIICDDSGKIQFIDYDLSCLIGNKNIYDTLENTNVTHGTLSYIDPVFARLSRSPTVDECIQNDYWALGVTLYDLTGLKHNELMIGFHNNDLSTNAYPFKLEAMEEKLKFFFGEYDISSLLTFGKRELSLTAKQSKEKWRFSRNNRHWLYKPTEGDINKMLFFTNDIDDFDSNKKINIIIEHDSIGNTFLIIYNGTSVVEFDCSETGIRFNKTFIHDLMDIRNKLEREKNCIKDNLSDNIEINLSFTERFKSN